MSDLTKNQDAASKYLAPFKNTVTGHFINGEIEWFSGGRLNASYNCIDRHIEMHGNKVAILWEGDDPADTKKITYKELLICLLYTSDAADE